MRVKWLRRALRNVEQVSEYIARDNPVAATNTVEKIRLAVARLQDYPHLGRPGRVRGTRELVILNAPYLVVYRLRGEAVEVLRVFHAARRWPTRF